MSNSIAVIERLASLQAKATFHVGQNQAKRLVREGQAIWAIPDKVLRKTRTYGSHQAENLIEKFRLTATQNTLTNLAKLPDQPRANDPNYLPGKFTVEMGDSRYSERLESVKGMTLRLEREGKLAAA